MKNTNDDSIDKQQIIIDKEEIIDVYRKYLVQQREHFFDTVTGANRGESFFSIIKEKSMFEAEYVDGILRHLIGQQDHLSQSVGIFPTYNKDVLLRIARDIVAGKILAAPQYQHLVKDSTPLQEVSKITDPKELAQRNEEVVRRNHQDKTANRIAEEILQENGLSADKLLSLHLESIALGDSAFLGNIKNNDIFYGNCHQYIIPLLEGEHYTVVTAYITKKKEGDYIHLRYYDSFGKHLTTNDKNQLSDFFYKMGFAKVLYLSLSKAEQKEYHNCGIFASFKAVDIVNEQAGCDDRLLADLSDYKELFSYFRYRVAEILFESGCNVSLSPAFFQTLVEQQQCRDIRQSEQEQHIRQSEQEQQGLFFNLKSLLGFKRIREVSLEKKEHAFAPSLSKNDSNKKMTLIGNRYWPAFSLEQHDFEKKSNPNVEQPSKNISPTSSPKSKRRK